MKNTLALLTLILMSFVSLQAQAAAWSSATKISKIYPHSTYNTNGTIYLKFDSMINPESCNNSSFIALRKDNNLSSEIYSLLMMAFTLDRELKYYVQGCDDHGFPRLLHVLIDS